MSDTPISYTYIDVDNQTVYLSGDVDAAMYHAVARGLTQLVDYDELTIVINTYGGDLYQALAIYDMLRFSGHSIKAVCTGAVMSAGTIILQAAAERVSMPSTSFLVHYGEDGGSTSTTEAHHTRELIKMMKSILCERVNVKPQRVGRWFSKETYFSAEQALKVGLIDRIVPSGEEKTTS